MHVMFIDVKRAYLHSPAVRDVYVDLPDELAEEGMCGKLLKAMYGTRDAAQCWERKYVKVLEDMGFRVGQSSRCVFWHPEKKVRAVVHGDDITVSGTQEQLM